MTQIVFWKRLILFRALEEALGVTSLGPTKTLLTKRSIYYTNSFAQLNVNHLHSNRQIGNNHGVVHKTLGELHPDGEPSAKVLQSVEKTRPIPGAGVCVLRGVPAGNNLHVHVLDVVPPAHRLPLPRGHPQAVRDHLRLVRNLEIHDVQPQRLLQDPPGEVHTLQHPRESRQDLRTQKGHG